MAQRHLTGTSKLRRVFEITFTLFSSRRKEIVLAVLTFAMLSAVVSAATGQRIRMIEDRIASETHLSWQQLHNGVNERLQTFNEDDARMIMAGFGFRTSIEILPLPSLAPDNAALHYVVSVAPWILLSFGLNLCIFFVASVFFLLLAGRPHASTIERVLRLPAETIRMIGLLLWYFVRSLLWLPFVGILIAFFVTPRLVLAPAVFSKGKTGIFQSFRESMKATRGHWFFIVFSLIAAFLFSIAFLWFCVVVVSLLTLFSMKLGFLVWLTALMLIVAFSTFFFVKLEEGLMD